MTDERRVMPQIQPEKYAKFIGQIELANVALLSARVNNLSFAEPLTPRETTPEITITKPKSRYENKPGKFHAFQNYTVQISDAAKNRQAAKLTVEFALAYRSQMPMTDEIFSVFKELNLVVHTWPYLREFIHSIAGRMNWPPLILPTFKVGIPPRKSRSTPREARKLAGEVEQSKEKAGSVR